MSEAVGDPVSKVVPELRIIDEVIKRFTSEATLLAIIKIDHIVSDSLLALVDGVSSFGIHRCPALRAESGCRAEWGLALWAVSHRWLADLTPLVIVGGFDTVILPESRHHLLVGHYHR
jgi:hypothetical protein